MPAETPPINPEWASSPLSVPLQVKLTRIEELAQTARDLELALEAAQRPRWLSAGPENPPELQLRPFTHRIVRRKTVNERELAFAREEARLLLRELDQAARNQICADQRLRSRIGELIAADATEMAEWQGVEQGGRWISLWY